MSTVYPSRKHPAVACIGILVFALSASAAPTAADVAKLQALQQQLDDLNAQLALLLKARESVAAQRPMQTNGSMMRDTMRGMDTSADDTRMMNPTVSMTVPDDEVLEPERDSRGAQLVSRYCSQCHAAPSPSLHTQEEWKSVTQRMRGHIGEAAATGRGILVPSTPDLTALTRYLSEHSTPQH